MTMISPVEEVDLPALYAQLARGQIPSFSVLVRGRVVRFYHKEGHDPSPATILMDTSLLTEEESREAFSCLDEVVDALWEEFPDAE